MDGEGEEKDDGADHSGMCRTDTAASFWLRTLDSGRFPFLSLLALDSAQPPFCSWRILDA